jgi:hypothetical protein
MKEIELWKIDDYLDHRVVNNASWKSVKFDSKETAIATLTTWLKENCHYISPDHYESQKECRVKDATISVENVADNSASQNVFVTYTYETRTPERCELRTKTITVDGETYTKQISEVVKPASKWEPLTKVIEKWDHWFTHCFKTEVTFEKRHVFTVVKKIYKIVEASDCTPCATVASQVTVPAKH